MAIIIQEERNKSYLTTIIVAAVILVVAGIAAYYFFFSPVPLVEKIEGGEKYQAVSKLAGAKINVLEITNSPAWKALAKPSLVPALDLTLPSRRSNPFESF